MMELLAHRVDGSGEPLVLLNGGMMSIAAWDEIAGPLAARFRVVRCDFRGQLLSPAPSPRDLTEHAADVIALLDALDIRAAHLVGTSFGSEVALVIAARHPARVLSLVAATAFDYATPEMRLLAQALRDVCRDAIEGGDGGRMFEAMVETTYGDAFRAANAPMLAERRNRVASLPRSWFAGVDGILATVQECDLRPLLPRIACRTLVVVAGLDRMALPERGRALAGAIPGALLVELPGSAHALVVEEPRRFAALCLEFLATPAGTSPQTTRSGGTS